jgi:hypothetical protein
MIIDAERGIRSIILTDLYGAKNNTHILQTLKIAKFENMHRFITAVGNSLMTAA